MLGIKKCKLLSKNYRFTLYPINLAPANDTQCAEPILGELWS